MRTGTNRKRSPAQPTGATLAAQGTTLTCDWGTNGDGSTLSISLVNILTGNVATQSALDSAETLEFNTPGVPGQTYLARLTAYLNGEPSKITTTGTVTVE